MEENEIGSIKKYLERPQNAKLWGQPVEGQYYLLDTVHGDGGKIIYFETMDSRPYGYFVRVDSSLNLDIVYGEILPNDSDSDCDFEEMIMRMIEQEYDNIDSYEENGDGLYIDPDDDETEPFEYNMPMFSLGAGYSWEEINMDELIRLSNEYNC